ncbi:MAG TPA: nucleotide sugar dehydrogenase [bacterium]|nr:nucleotide sugar dehydrogenase [bacterium]
MTRISVIGLGKLGLCTAACFASRGFDVVGVDVEARTVQLVNDGIPPMYEPRLSEVMAAAGGRLRATGDYRTALERSDVTFLVVPTPSAPNGEFSDHHLRDALMHLSRALRDSRKRSHLFAVTSTVSPGTIDGSLTPLIETTSGRAIHDGFDVCYNPEFIALGSVITDFLNPDLVLIGENRDGAGTQLEEIYRKVCENTPQIARMSIISAEITKLSLNSFVTTKISFANTLAAICEAMPGADIDAITRALGADRRVSPYSLRGGLPFGGPCFPRDNRAFATFAEQHGVDARLAKATDEINRARTHDIVELVQRHLPRKNRRVGILGLSYKAGTPIVEESPALALIDELLGAGDLEITVYDPLALEPARAVLGDRVSYAPSSRACVGDVSVCIIMTAAQEFHAVEETYVGEQLTAVIDCWRILDAEKLGPRVCYVALGRPVE